MQVVIAHQSAIQKARLRSRLSAMPGADVVRIVSELHETYDYAEHHQPDCIVMSGRLANRPEFELLDALLRTLGIGCILLQEPEDVAEELMSAHVAEHVVRLPSSANDATLHAALQQCHRAAPRVTPTFASPAIGKSQDPDRIVLIGSSTGGVDALLQIISEFPADCPPTLIVQHTGGSYAQSLIRLLAGATAAKVIAAQDGMPLARGEIYLAPGDTAHLKLRSGRRRQIALVAGPPVSGHRPLVDALFMSALDYATHVTAALLTGMGRDGAEGITCLRKAGARTFGQDAATSVVYGMPRVAREMGGIEMELPLPKIGAAILNSSQLRMQP